MSLIRKIEHAFEHRSKPFELVDPRNPFGTDENDALWFAGRDWHEFTWDDWEKYSGALYAFVPEAFAYYLPSILSLSYQYPDKWFGPADTLLRVLDRSPVVECWDAFVVTRLVGLQTAEYDVLKEWVLWLSDHPMLGSEEDLGRALDTIDLLQSEANRIRLMIDSASSS